MVERAEPRLGGKEAEGGQSECGLVAVTLLEERRRRRLPGGAVVEEREGDGEEKEQVGV